MKNRGACERRGKEKREMTGENKGSGVMGCQDDGQTGKKFAFYLMVNGWHVVTCGKPLLLISALAAKVLLHCPAVARSKDSNFFYLV